MNSIFKQNQTWLILIALLSFGLISSQIKAEENSGTRLVLLGTAGGPSIKKARAQPANAVIVNGSVYIVDAGNGVARQMALAGISAKKLRAVFITHNHTDHNADYGTLLLRAWLSGLKTPVDTFGPPPLKKMTNAYMEYMDWEIKLRIRDENRVPLQSLVRANNIEGDGVIYKDENITVTAFEVPHGAAKPSYGFRFDTPDRSIVFSGDTARSDNLIKTAKGADVLVHEVVSIHGVEAIVNRIDPGNDALKRHIIEAHTPTEEVGEVAAAAGVKKLVLNHFVPTGLPAFDNPELWIKGIRKHYQGEVVVGKDLLEID
ncbi:MBL fold metallo-hydrolase [Neptunomonas antarctica]|uniref:Ribonuclease BN, tRNA processing enzyme n=1 Tax=Neptunomonas antarctica TaxID=619304 RepID=A0A1N7JFX1_9GAMM|nr:MBL fold metallo-hydrolase [Neptunomonas antarctica]SIS48245.1 Ribonuclease BN, tRNA processing enzyme [Neptunomonas antarctica]